MFLKSISLLIVMFISSNLNAAGFFEPYAGLNFGTFDEQISNINGTVNGVTINSPSSQVSGDFSGITLGLRVYEKFLDQFILGGDIGLGFSSGKLTYNVLTSMGEYNITTISPGLIIGWDVPTFLLPRIWAGFYPFNSLHLIENGSKEDPDKYSGNSFKLGVSFDWWIQLGIEYSSHEYKTLNGKKLPYTATLNGLTMTQEKVKYDEVIVTLSYPFSL